MVLVSARSSSLACQPAALASPSSSTENVKVMTSNGERLSVFSGIKPIASSRILKSRFVTGRTFLSGQKGSLDLSRSTKEKRSMAVRAAVATEAPSKITNTFSVDGNEIEVYASGATDEDRANVILQVKNGPLVNAQLIAHWGATKHGETGWTLPGLQPDGTKNYKNRALQSRFHKEGNDLILKIEVADAKYDAIEFLLKDEASNSWFKYDNGNFRITIPPSSANVDPSKVVIPTDLLNVNAYLNWEKNGKQNYSPEQEKEEYEKGRLELQTMVASGQITIEGLRQKLLGGGEPSKTEEPEYENSTAAPDGPDVPEDLMAIQSYIRWERNGKQNYSPEQQAHEYSETRKELQNELRNGVSVEELRKRLSGGTGSTAPPPPPPKKTYTSTSANRRHRDLDSLISKVGKAGDVKVAPSREPTKLEAAASVVEAQEDVIYKKFVKFGGDQVLVLVTEVDGTVKVRLASSISNPLIAHWGLAKGKGQEWKNAQQTPLEKGFGGDSSLQFVDLPLGEDSKEFAGVPFVLNSGDNWYKDMGADFWVGIQKAEQKSKVDAGDGSGTAKALLDEIADEETEAQRSLMHRFNIGAGIVDRASGQGELGMAAVLVWFRFMATRQLIWNKNYNVKPREISAAQDRMTDNLRRVYQERHELRELVRGVMMTVGRGGEGDVGQRIRDEILVIQRANDCKGGMMEEWHQKLHNNTSPDDVVICQALLDHISSNFDMDVYWKTLNSNGVSRERLRSYDRPIVSEPKLRADQKDGLFRDLTNYMKSLKAVHSGADLESAIATCMGYKQGASESFMQSVEIHPIGGLSNELPGYLKFVLEHVEDKRVVPLMEGLLEARNELRPTLLGSSDRLKDIIFLDLALDSTLRTAVDRGMEYLDYNNPAEILYAVSLVLENLILSSDNNAELVYCLKDLRSVIQACKNGEDTWALRAKAVTDRTQLALAEKAEYLQKILQPSADYLGAKLNVDEWAVSIFTEEIVRSGSAASLSLLLNRFQPILRKAADMGSWQVISPVDVKGFVEVVDDLGTVQDKVYTRPTIVIAGKVKGEEEIPDGAVAVLTPDMPDILSHVSVRARNCKVLFATCFDEKVLADLRSKDKKTLSILHQNADLNYSEISESEVSSSPSGTVDDVPDGISIKKKQFAGKFALRADDFTPDLVGAKSRNIAGLRGKLPAWVNLPTSVALPFGSFDKVLEDPLNKEVAVEVNALSKELTAGDFSKLPAIREAVLKLSAPPKLIEELKSAMKDSGMPFPGDVSEERWEQAWKAIKRVWASKWNERAYFSTRKAKLNHDDLSMAVLVQEIIQADYAFVIHTINPSTEDETEIYAEVVKGLGETLVGAFSGRALSLSAKKTSLDSPKVLGFPSKRIGLFIKQSIIFRSDSNGEDLEGYAGAGLYDSVPMDLEDEVIVDYSSDPLLLDSKFQHDILTKIVKAGAAIENLLGSAQDIEGVIKNGELYVVQTRPQM